MAQQHEPPFKSAYRNLNQKFNNIFTRTVLTKKDLESLDVESITKKFDEAWEKFLQRDLQAFAEIVKQQDWLKD